MGAICVGSRFTCLLLLDFFLLDECLDVAFDVVDELVVEPVVEGVAGLYLAVCRAACVFDSERPLAVVCVAVVLWWLECEMDVAL